jgi:hypothetical protein
LDGAGRVTEEQGTLFRDPLTDMDDECVVGDAAQDGGAVVAAITAAAGSCDYEKMLGGSSVGRRSNADRSFDKGFARLTSDSHGVNPTHEAAKFARRFRMPQSVFNCIYTALSVRPEFVQRADALDVFELHPLKESSRPFRYWVTG